MNIICNQRNLALAITNAQKAINNRTTIELLKGIMLKSVDNKLIITGYDNELSIETQIEADVKSEGSIVVNSRLIGDIIRKLPDTFVSIETDEQYNIFINCLNSRFKIKGLPADEFPKQEDISTDSMIKFNQFEFKNMIRQTVFATAIEPINPTLAGEYLDINGDKVNLVALDGYRLAVRKSELEEGIDGNISAIIPGTTLNHINALLNDDGNLYIGFDSKNIILKINNTKIVARLIEGNYTKYDSLLPKDYITKIRVNTKKLHECIDRAALLFTSVKNNLIKISISYGLMIITSNNENGNAYEEVNIDFEGDELDIAFNSKYLLEGIKNIESEFIDIEFGGPINPAIIKPIDGPEYIYLLLPVRIGN